MTKDGGKFDEVRFCTIGADRAGVPIAPFVNASALERSRWRGGRYAWARSKMFPYQHDGGSIRNVMIGCPAFEKLGLAQAEELLSTEPVGLLSP
jgi:hypothetical protein